MAILERTKIKRRAGLLNATLNQEVRQVYSPLTDYGKDNGIEIFKMSDYYGRKVLVYFPQVKDANGELMRDPATGKRTKYFEKVFTRQLQTTGGKYLGLIRDTKGLNVEADPFFADRGITGTDCFEDLSQKVFDYNNAVYHKEIAVRFGAKSKEEVPEEDHKAIWREIYRKTPLGEPKATYWFPVVIIECEEGHDIGSEKGVKFVMVDKTDAEGKPIIGANGQPEKTLKTKICWFKVSDTAFKEKFLDTFKDVALEENEYDEAGNLVREVDGTDFAGYFGILDYTNIYDSKTGKEITDATQLGMHVGRKYGVSILSPELNKNKKLYSSFKSLFVGWDAEAEDYYNETMLEMCVRDCVFLSDEELKTKLAEQYKNLAGETAALKELTEGVLAGGGKAPKLGAVAVLAGNATAPQLGQVEVTQQVGVAQQVGATQQIGTVGQEDAFGAEFDWNAVTE